MKTTLIVSLIGAALFGVTAFLIDLTGEKSSSDANSAGFAMVYFMLGFVLFGVVSLLIQGISKMTGRK